MRRYWCRARVCMCPRDLVARESVQWSSIAAASANWGMRLLVLSVFVCTLAHARGMVAGILNSKLPIGKILKDLVKTLQVKCELDGCDGE